MDDADRQSGAGHDSDPAPDAPDDAASDDAATLTNTPPPAIDESLVEEMGALIDDGRNYAQAELAFQKTRAKLAGSLVGMSLGLVIIALILLHIAFLALAVGLVIALEPVVTIWGAIGIVFGGLLLVVVLLGWAAFKRVQKLGDIFSSGDEEAEQ